MKTDGIYFMFTTKNTGNRLSQIQADLLSLKMENMKFEINLVGACSRKYIILLQFSFPT